MTITLSDVWGLLNLTTLLIGTILALLLLEHYLTKKGFTFFQAPDVSSQVRIQLQQLILSQGTASLSTLAATTGMEETEVMSHIRSLSDIQLSTAQQVFSYNTSVSKTSGDISWDTIANPYGNVRVDTLLISLVGGLENNIDNIDVSAAPIVPIPSAVWLFGTGLLGLAGMARRKAA